MSILEAAIGWLAPARCVSCGQEGTALCNGCAASEIIAYGEQCWLCGAKSPDGRTCPKCRLPGTPRHVWITTNYEGAAADLVKKYKFGHLRAAGLDMARLMADTFGDFNSLAGRYLVVPLPTATSRRRQRGFDHSVLLARAVSRRLGLQSAVALGRLGQNRQLGASRQDRLTQQAGNYYVRWPRRVAGQDILLIDDVVTTGASIRAAGLALRKAGARRVDALVFAKRL